MKRTYLLYLYPVWEYYLGKTKRFAVNSTLEIIEWGVKRLFKKEQKMISKQYGPLTLSQDNGVATIAIDESVSVGGGSMKGVVSASGKASVEVHELVLVDAGLSILAGKFPNFAPEIALIKSAVDGELSKI